MVVDRFAIYGDWLGWNPASNSEGEEGFVVKEVQGWRGRDWQPASEVTRDALTVLAHNLRTFLPLAEVRPV